MGAVLKHRPQALGKGEGEGEGEDGDEILDGSRRTVILIRDNPNAWEGN